MDTTDFDSFLAACCILSPRLGPTPFIEIQQAFLAWCATNDRPDRSPKWIGIALNRAGCEKGTHHGAAVSRLGIALR